MMDNRERLRTGAETIGIALDDRQLDQFFRYAAMLKEWNGKVNLTAITEEREVVEKHFLDSLLVASVMDLAGILTVIDIGTGAGFPGIPLKIAFPHLKVSLLDTLNKRVEFLEEVVSALGLEEVDCIHGRAEDMAKTPEMRESFDLAVSRAVSKLNVLSEYCIPFVKVGGCFAAYKSVDSEEETQEAENAARLLGAKIGRVETLAIPGTATARKFIVIDKVETTPAKYPRKAGKPSKAPL